MQQILSQICSPITISACGKGDGQHTLLYWGENATQYISVHNGDINVPSVLIHPLQLPQFFRALVIAANIALRERVVNRYQQSSLVFWNATNINVDGRFILLSTVVDGVFVFSEMDSETFGKHVEENDNRSMGNYVFLVHDGETLERISSNLSGVDFNENFKPIDSVWSEQSGTHMLLLQSKRYSPRQILVALKSEKVSTSIVKAIKQKILYWLDKHAGSHISASALLNGQMPNGYSWVLRDGNDIFVAVGTTVVNGHIHLVLFNVANGEYLSIAPQTVENDTFLALPMHFWEIVTG
jgi:hypothetical protein